MPIKTDLWLPRRLKCVRILFLALRSKSQIAFFLSEFSPRPAATFIGLGARIEDTTNDVLTRCGCINPIADENAIRIPTTAESRRSRAHDAVVHRAGTFAVLPVGKGSQAPSERSRVLVA